MKTNSKEDSRSQGSPEWVNRWMAGNHSLDAIGSISAAEMLEMAALGFSMYEQGRYDNAKVIFSGLCALDPRESYYRTALGAIYMAQEDLDTAQQLFDAAIDLNQSEIASFVNRGEVHLRRGRIAKAAADFRAAVNLDPENKDPLSRRARLLAAAALQALEAAHGPRPAGAKPGTAQTNGSSKDSGPKTGRKR